MTLALDTGALIAFDRGDRNVAALIDAARRRGDTTVTSSGCVAQAWRQGGPRQALLHRLLAGIEEFPLDAGSSRAVGMLCAKSGHADIVDGHLATLVRTGDVVLTSDPSDLRRLLRTRGVKGLVVSC
jgi:hypothetical protein